MREMDRLLGEEGGGGFNPDPTTMCGDKKGVVPRFEIVKSPLVSD